MHAKTQTFNVSQISDYQIDQDNSIKSRLPEYTRKHLSKVVKTMLDEADDTLFDYSIKADTNLTQQAYLDAMREIRINRSTIEQGFLNAVQAAFNTFQKDKNLPDHLKTETLHNTEMLELIDEESVEEDIAIHNMADKQERRYQREIFELKSRIKAVYQCHDDAVEIHPLSPITIVKAFAVTLKAIDTEFHIKLIILKLFDKYVMNSIGHIYQEINSLLINEKILPTLSYQYKRNHHKTRTPASPDSYSQQLLEQTLANTADWDTVDNVNYQSANLSNTNTSKTDSLLPTDFGLQGFIPVPTQSSGVIGTLSDMQNFLSQESIDIANNPKQIGQSIINGIQRMGFTSVKTKRELDDSIINMVSMIFDFIVEEKSITDQIRNLLRRLQIPFLKLALLDESFLTDKQHPARQLLNTMVDAAVGWDGKLDNDNLYNELEHIVDKVLHDYERDAGLFENLLNSFNEYWKNRKQLNKNHEERTWKTTEGKERLTHAKNRVDTWIHMWCSRDNIRQQVAVFLKHFWKNTMLNCIHKYGENSKEWQYYIKLINNLIWSTTPGKDSDEVKQLINITPVLIRGINRGLLAVGTHPKTISDIFNEFSRCHMEIIEKGLEKPDTNLENTNALQAIDSIYDISNIESDEKINLADENSLDKLSIETPVAIDRAGSETVEDITLEDEYYQLASTIKYGDWIEFMIDTKLVHAKLAWKSNISKNHLFVGRNGMRIAEKNLTDIADELREGIARIIDQSPVIDRALSAIQTRQD